MSKGANLYSVFLSIFLASKMVGLAPFTIAKEKYKRSYISVTLSLIIITSILVCTIIFVSDRPVLGSSILTKAPEIVNSYLSPFTMFLYVIFGCVSNQKILDALQALHVFDQESFEFFKLDLEKEYEKSRMYAMSGLGSVIVAVALSFSFTLLISRNNSPDYFLHMFFTYIIPLVINVCICLQCCALILALKRRFGWINDKIVGITKHHANKKFPDNPQIVLDRLRVKHHVLCKIAKKINSSYAPQILLIVLKNFVTIITSLYFCGKYSLYFGSIQIDFLIYFIVQITVAILQLLALCVSCSSTSSEAKITGSLIHDAVRISNRENQAVKEQITVFSLQLLHQKVEFTACGIFIVNESLLLTVIGAAATYLVIVVQFQLQELKTPK